MAAFSTSNIPIDCLLTIFDTISEQLPPLNVATDLRPLTVIRTASQICRQWRHTLLASPWIWGRLIDLEAAKSGPQNYTWMQEVLKRAGHTPLWIYGEPIHTGHRRSSSICGSIFLRLLKSWERIEKLSVVINGKTFSDAMMNCFLSRAPILKHFEVIMPGLPMSHSDLFIETLQPGSSKRLFADHAPLLRVMNANPIAFRLDSPWLSGICEMDPIPYRLTAQEVFLLLRRAPKLEIIRVETQKRFLEEEGMLSNLHLPNLTSFCLSTTSADGARILDHLTPVKLANLSIRSSGSEPHSMINKDIILSFTKHLPFYISTYSTSRPSSPFQLHIDSNLFTFIETPMDVYDSSSFHIQCDFGRHRASGSANVANDVMHCLFDAIIVASTRNPALFTSIREMKLNLRGAQRSEKLQSMLMVFPKVRLLRMDRLTTRSVVRLFQEGYGTREDTCSIVFPELQTICLIKPNSLSEPIMDVIRLKDDLTSLLLHRKRIGFPVSTLDLTAYGRADFGNLLNGLEKVDGLEVVWEQGVRPYGGPLKC